RATEVVTRHIAHQPRTHDLALLGFIPVAERAPSDCVAGHQAGSGHKTNENRQQTTTSVIDRHPKPGSASDGASSTQLAVARTPAARPRGARARGPRGTRVRARRGRGGTRPPPPGGHRAAGWRVHFHPPPLGGRSVSGCLPPPHRPASGKY